MYASASPVAFSLGFLGFGQPPPSRPPSPPSKTSCFAVFTPSPHRSTADCRARPQLSILLLSSPLVPTLVSLPLFATASAFKMLFKGGSISISSTCPRPPPYFSFTSWVLRFPLPISSQLTWFFRSRGPGCFHRLMWGSFTIMVPIS